jgi:hypothetical protein
MHASAVERKKMLALLIEDVTLVAGAKVAVNVRWRGGRNQTLLIDRPVPIARIRKTLPHVVQLIDELLETMTDKQIAVRLNELGHRNWRGDTFTMKKVILVRGTYDLKSRFQRLRERGLLTGEELARQFGVSSTTVHQLGRAGLLQRQLYGNNHRCLYEPPGDVKLIKGVPSRAGSRPPRLIAVQPSERGAI